VNIDTVRIGRVMANLIDNACKYSPGGSKVKVFARRNDEGILVSISDQGPGIPLEYHESLFEPFNRLGNEKNTKGIGLGLVVCKHLVEAHNGRIWVESKPGEGSTFGFNIPLSKEI
jgi:signal transduction histidine kinase